MNEYNRTDRIHELATTTAMSIAEATAAVDAELALAEASRRRGAELDDTRFVTVPNRADRRRTARAARRADR